MSIEDFEGIAVQTATTNITAIGNQDKFDIFENNMRAGLAEVKQFAQEARAERDLARNRSVELRTELDMSQARTAKLERELQQAKNDATLRRIAATNLQEQLLQIQNALDQARKSAQQEKKAAAEAKAAAQWLANDLQQLAKEYKEERNLTDKMKGKMRELAAECPWQTEKTVVPGGKKLDELLRLAT